MAEVLILEAEQEPWVVRAYHRLLVWDLMCRPWLTRIFDALLSRFWVKASCSTSSSHRSTIPHRQGCRMNAPFLAAGVFPKEWLRPTVDFLLATQRPSGEIRGLRVAIPTLGSY